MDIHACVQIYRQALLPYLHPCASHSLTFDALYGADLKRREPKTVANLLPFKLLYPVVVPVLVAISFIAIAVRIHGKSVVECYIFKLEVIYVCALLYYTNVHVTKDRKN